MSEMNRYTAYEAQDGLQSYITGVYSRMGIALAVTALTAWFGYQGLTANIGIFNVLLGSPVSALLFIICQFAICVALSAGLTRLEGNTASVLFYVYAFITGITFSILPYAYNVGTLFGAFAFAALMFACCIVIGKTTTADLSKLTPLLMGGLLALIAASVLSFFIPVLRNSLAVCYIGVILFLALTAYDMQRIKAFYYSSSGQMRENLSVYGAFQLYLDFINIFLYVLRILASGSSRRK